ncbi:MAG TPA: helix-turn-helix domain-containing protein [Bauldia sp.]|nr:helix-turn-helix domain-containing protein [Bauldia sp.]
MDTSDAIAALTSLAQETRLTAFRFLVDSHPEAHPAGEIARVCRVPHNTMSTHLSHLVRAGLITVTRSGRSMLYRADTSGFRALVAFLAHDCCNGRPEICAPILSALPAASCDCQPENARG